MKVAACREDRSLGAATVVRTIQLIIAPVLMLNATALIVNGLLSRFKSIGNRLRHLTKEQLDLLAPTDGANQTAEYRHHRIAIIEHQLPGLLRRHGWMHNAVLAAYGSILLYVASMVIIAGAALSDSNEASYAALVVFICGTLVLLVGVVYSVLEVRSSQQAAEYEVMSISRLKQQ